MSEPKGLLPERVVLISGGTAGLGAGIARAAAREGATVAVTGRRREPGEALAAELSADGTKALFVQADVADVAAGASLRGGGDRGVRPGGQPGQRGRADHQGHSCSTPRPSCSTRTSR